jgi:formylglycine-generating enzyme required for sulfatase activity
MTTKLLRGGSWYNSPPLCRAALRYSGNPDSDNPYLCLGVRPCCPSPLLSHHSSSAMSTTTASSALEALQALGLILKDIPTGSFLMGSPSDEAGRYSDEGPQHTVTLPAFRMSDAPITQEQWRWVATNLPQVERPLEPSPSRFQGDDRPVERVSWLDAQEFCARLTAATGTKFSLPSEAQWEYACRAGTTTPFNTGESLSHDQANFGGEVGETTPVRKYAPNAWGLYDMHGNVWEWCQDSWHASYEGAPTDGSAWE